MKLKFLLSTSLLLVGAYLAKGQTYGTWAGQSNATPFEYSIAAGTLGSTYSAIATAQSSESTSPTAGFLSYPSSGTAKVSTGENAGGGFTISGNKLTMAASSLGGSPNKFGLHSISGTSAVTSIFFKLSLNGSPSGGTGIIAFGSSTGTIFTNNNQLWNTAGPGVFGALRFQPGNTQSNTGVRYYRGVNDYGYTDPAVGGNSYTLFTKTGDLDIEIYCNNTNVARYYNRGIGLDYTLPARTYNIFVNGTLFDTGSATNIAASDELVVDQKIDALFVAAHSSSGNALSVSISDIKFGWIPENVLPVELTSFTGKKVANGVQLNWATASEKDNAYFEVLRAADDGIFRVIDKVNGKGNGSANTNYQFVDKSPLNGKNYYKLKQVDLNGNYREFGPELVTFDLETSKLNAFVNSENKLLLSYTASANAKASLTVADLSGKKLVNSEIVLSKGINQPVVDVSKLRNGLYIVRLAENNNITATKFIKK